MNAVNFDAAAGIALHPVAIAAMNAAFEDGWADPAKISGQGRRSAVLLAAARATASELLSARPEEIVFVSSGALALQLAVLGALAGRSRAGDVLVHSAVEHSTVLHAAQWHCQRGGRAQQVPVDSYGQVSADEFIAAASQPGVAVAVLQAANHEVGTRQPVSEVSAALQAIGVPLIVDASNDFLYASAPEAAIFTLDARLWGGPGGVGVLVIRSGARWRAPWPTDDSEFGRGLGSPNVASIVAAMAALKAHRSGATATGERLFGLVELIRRRLPALIDDSEVLGHPTDRLPHLVTFSSLYLSGESLLSELDRSGFSVSSGSSCTSDTLTPSHVLVAMNALTSGNVRVSLPPQATQAEVEEFLAALSTAVSAVRAHYGEVANYPDAEMQDARSWSSDATPMLIDSRGRRCPLPVLDLARAIPAVAIGGDVTVLADDPAAASDIAAWCRMRGQLLLATSDLDGGGSAYRVRRVR